jgi:MFS family permease
MGEEFLAPLFFLARVANALSHLGAVWIAKHIGLLNTMVFTHIPSSLFLIAIPFAPDVWTAAALFLLRESLVQMDVPTRQSYIAAVVNEEERPFATGVTTLSRNAAWAASPAISGSLMGMVSLSVPLFVGAGLKIVYDVMLYVSFRKIRVDDDS